MTREFINTERIAYFTMEIGLQADIPTYSGVLAAGIATSTGGGIDNGV